MLPRLNQLLEQCLSAEEAATSVEDAQVSETITDTTTSATESTNAQATQ